jgi:hypothetical protein
MTFEPRLIKAIYLCKFSAKNSVITEKSVKKCYDFYKSRLNKGFKDFVFSTLVA